MFSALLRPNAFSPSKKIAGACEILQLVNLTE